MDVDERGLQNLESTLREVERISERAATETQSIALAAGKAETNFEDLARAMGITEAQARDLTTELLQSQAASNRLEDAARDVARQLGLSDDEAKRLTGSLRQADRAADDIDTTTSRVATNFGSLRTAAVGVASAFAAIGGAQLLGGAVRGANAAIQSFARLEDSINAVNVVFENAAAGVLTFGESAARSAGLSQEAFNQSVVPIGSLLQNFGFDAREAADAAVILVQRGADLASVYGGTVHDALLAVGAALRGEADPLERYGASISAARVETFALAEGLARTKAEITPAIQLQARYGLILADTARVAGDYLNTADDLANAQRTAGAELQNFVADIGEELAPALASLVLLLPEVLDGLRQLVPGFANAADSAADFFNSINEGAGGFRAPLQAFAAGLGLVGDAFGGLADIGSGLFDTLQLDFEGVGDQMDQFGDRFARTAQRIVGQNLARSLDAGTDKLNAFGRAISAFALQSENVRVFADTYRTFAIQANLSGEELRTVTQALIDQGSAAGLSAAEIEFLNDQITQLNGLLAVDTRRRGPFEAIEEIPFETITGRFTTFTSTLGEIPAQMETVATQMRAASGNMADALNPFDDAAEGLGVSAREFFNNLTKQINAEAEFQAGIVELILREQFNLAAIIGEQGPAAQEALDGFLANINLADAAERSLSGGGTELSNEIGDQLTAAIANASTAEARQVFIDLINKGILTNSQVQAAIVTGTASAANRTVSSYREELEREADQFDTTALANQVETVIGGALDFSDAAAAQASTSVGAFKDGIVDEIDSPDNLIAAFAAKVSAVFASVDVLNAAQAAGQEARGAFWRGASIPASGEASTLRSSITETIDSAIYRDSPPKLFLDIGKESGDAFWSGFNQAELTLRTPPIPTGGTVVTSSGSAVGGDVNVNINLEARLSDPVSEVARMAQIAGSVAHTYNQVRN